MNSFYKNAQEQLYTNRNNKIANAGDICNLTFELFFCAASHGDACLSGLEGLGFRVYCLIVSPD